MNCARVRQSLPDLDAGLNDAQVLAHLASCRACAEESRIVRAVLEAAAEHASAGAPDPGDQYWEGFLPSVRARLLRPYRDARVHGWLSIRAVAAALLMTCVAAGTLVLPRPALIPDRSAAEASSQLERVLRQRPDMAPEIAADMFGVDPVLTFDAASVLTLFDETDQTTGLPGGGEDDGFWIIIDGLSREQTARLLAELSAEQG